jgi:hypothetical protein
MHASVKLEEGSARPLIKMFDVKKRQYFGNTSMEAEISLLMANQTLVIIVIPSVKSCRFFFVDATHDRHHQES